MEIIGEKINGTRKRVARAVVERDAAFIQDLAQRQAEAGSAYLDVNAGTKPQDEPEDLVWLVRAVQDVVDLPLCLDSANPQALMAAIEVVERTSMINSINGEAERLEGILPLVAGNTLDLRPEQYLLWSAGPDADQPGVSDAGPGGRAGLRHLGSAGSGDEDRPASY